MADFTADCLERIEVALAEVLRRVEDNAPYQGDESGSPSAIRWAVEGGGKRVRPLICLMSAVAAGGSVEDALMSACAIELLHSYTLVHDDLPAMDNDTMRRGKPSVWAKFGEATAILAGDALQAMAFRTAARAPRNASRIVASLAAAAEAVVYGQVADLEAAERRVEDNAPHQGDASESSAGIDDRAALRQEYIFANKTAALFVAAAEMGALSVDASPAAIEALKSYAYNLGFAFQYQDDLLDADDGAFSSLALFGADEVRRRVVEHTNIAISSLSSLPGTISPLKDLADHLLSRNC